MTNFELVKNYVDYYFGSLHSSFMLKYSINKEFMGATDVDICIIKKTLESKKYYFHIRYLDDKFYILDENRNWEEIIIRCELDKKIFRILFFNNFERF